MKQLLLKATMAQAAVQAMYLLRATGPSGRKLFLRYRTADGFRVCAAHDIDHVVLIYQHMDGWDYIYVDDPIIENYHLIINY